MIPKSFDKLFRNSENIFQIHHLPINQMHNNSQKTMLFSLDWPIYALHLINYCHNNGLMRKLNILIKV